MKIKKIFLVLLIVFFATPTFAGKIWEAQDFQSTFNAAKNNYLNTLNVYKEQRELYLDQLNQLKSEECKKDSQVCQRQRELMVDRAKRYLLKVKDHMAKYLTFVKTRIEGLNINEEDKNKIIDEISKDLEELDSKETEINNLTTAEQVKEFAKSFKIFWANEEVKVKKYIGYIAFYKGEQVVNRLEEIITKVDEKIKDLNSNDYDTASLESSLNKIKEKLNTAKTKLNEAKAIFDAITTTENAPQFNEGKTKFKEAAKLLKDVHSDLKSFVGEINSSKTKKSENSSSSAGNITVKGEGSVSFIGNGEIKGKIGNNDFDGTLIILDKAKDAKVEIFGKGDKAEFADGRVQYKGLDQVQIKGSDLVIEISSQFIDISINGKGSLVLKGDGLYKTKNGEWTDISGDENKLEI